jgi:hypothetical protein
MNESVTHHLVTTDAVGHLVTYPLTDDGRRSLVVQALAQPPVRFERIEGDVGWLVERAGHVCRILRADPTTTH